MVRFLGKPVIKDCFQCKHFDKGRYLESKWHCRNPGIVPHGPIPDDYSCFRDREKSGTPTDQS